MVQFVYGHDRPIAEFVAQFSGREVATFGHCRTIGVADDEGKLIAAMIYYNYDSAAEVIEFGLISIDRRFATRAVLKRMFEYPFIELGCQMVFVRARADDERLLGILARLNFSLTLIPRMYGRDEDGVVATLTDDQWLDSRPSRLLYRDARREAA